MEIKASRIDTSKLASKLGQLVNRALPLVVRQDILAKRLEPVRDLMQSKAPKDSGHSADTIAIEVMDAPDPTTAKVAVGVGKDGYPLFFQEYGTKAKPPRPTIRPAWESEARRVRDGVASDVSDAIRKAVA